MQLASDWLYIIEMYMICIKLVDFYLKPKPKPWSIDTVMVIMCTDGERVRNKKASLSNAI